MEAWGLNRARLQMVALVQVRLLLAKLLELPIELLFVARNLKESLDSVERFVVEVVEKIVDHSGMSALFAEAMVVTSVARPLFARHLLQLVVGLVKEGLAPLVVSALVVEEVVGKIAALFVVLCLLSQALVRSASELAVAQPVGTNLEMKLSAIVAVCWSVLELLVVGEREAGCLIAVEQLAVVESKAD